MSLRRFLLVRFGRLISYPVRRQLRRFFADCERPELVRNTLEAFQRLFERLQQVRQEAIRANDLEEAAYISDMRDRVEKMRVCFARKWPSKP